MLKSSDQRNHFRGILLIGLTAILWCYLFRSFLNGNVPLQGDAYAYLGHIRFYLENIMRGVYPLWNPWEGHGTTDEFFLRRIGEYNPFFWAIVFLNKSGIPFVMAHRLFLAAYFFLGVAGFYLLSQRLFHDHLVSFAAALLLLFSCIGASIFGSYLVLEFVPYIWFSYFLVAFMQEFRKTFLLGAVFSLMIINITYIPFYFYTLLFVLLICWLPVYASRAGAVCRQAKDFIVRHKIFTGLCALLLMLSFVPGILWYQEIRQGETLTMQRHAGSQDTNSATVGINKINEGGIIPDFIFNRQFVNMDKIGLGDFYVPLFTYLMLFAGLWGRLNRRLVLLFVFGFTVFLIGLADASCIHQFLYNHIPFFKYFRNVQFFLWLAILPVFILFAVEQMRIFIEDCRQSAVDRKWMSLWVVAVHLCAIGLFLQKNVGCMTYAVIIFNMVWMLGHIWSMGNSRIWLLLLWGAIILQPFEVYGRMAVNYLPAFQWGYDTSHVKILPTLSDVKTTINNTAKISKKDISSNRLSYFTSRWYYEAMGSVNNQILENYLQIPFLVYDRTEDVADKIDRNRLQNSLFNFENIAFVYSDTPYKVTGPVDPKARIITSADKDFKILKSDPNDVTVQTVFTKPSFLVRTQNYHDQWKVFIDDQPAVLLRTNICAQGLWVPAGEHVVHWHFGTPARYVWAYFLVILYPSVLIGLICLWLRSRNSV